MRITKYNVMLDENRKISWSQNRQKITLLLGMRKLQIKLWI